MNYRAIARREIDRGHGFWHYAHRDHRWPSNHFELITLSARLRIPMVIRLNNRVRTSALISLFLVTGLVGAALVWFRTTESAARTAEQELVAFKEHAREEAQKRRIFPVSPSGFVVAMSPPIVSSSERAQIDALQQRYDSLLYRHALADWLFTRGMVVAIVIVGFCWFLKQPGQSPETTSGLATGRGSS